MDTILMIGTGAFIGANLRYLISTLMTAYAGNTFPWGTLIINFSGSVVLAIFTGWLAQHTNIDPRLRLLVAVGFCGGYTTFSSFSVEAVALMQAGNITGAAAYIIGTNLVCIVGAIFGLMLGSKL
jgi:fluoride exporter